MQRKVLRVHCEHVLVYVELYVLGVRFCIE